MEAIKVAAPEAAHDPFTLDIIKNALAAIADEMANTVARTARSFVVKEALDFSTALFNADGELIAQGTCLPLHMGAMPFAIEAAERAFRGDMREGDVYVMNDPWDGSTHLPDVVCVKPVFMDGDLVGYAAALAHQTDIGGRVAGGNASDSTEIYQEGLRLPPVRLYDSGEPVEAIFRIIERNVRVPDIVIGDIRSEVAACAIGERQLLDLIGKYGKESVRSVVPGAAGLHGAVHALRDREAAGRKLPVHRLDRRRRDRSRSDPILLLHLRARRRPHRRFRGHRAPGAGRHQFRLPVHGVGGAGLRARRPGR